MINALLTGLVSFATGLVSLLLKPIDLLITNNVPQMQDALTLIGRYFSLGVNYVGWLLDLSFLESETVSLIVLIAIFRLTIPLIVSTVKLLIKWWDSIVA